MEPHSELAARTPLWIRVAGPPRSVNIRFGSTCRWNSPSCAAWSGILLYLREGYCEGNTLTVHHQLALSTLAAASVLVGCSLTHPGKSMKQAIGHPPTLALQLNVASHANID